MKNLEYLNAISYAALFLNIVGVILAPNELGENAIKVVEALIPLKSLKNLNLSSNDIGEDVVAVAEKIVCLSNFETLNLSDNLIEEDAPAVVKALAPLIRLKNLDLSNDLIVKNSPATAKKISEIPNLETLNFSGNDFKSSDLETIETLTSLSCLRDLDFSSNELGTDQKGAAATILKFNSLCYLNLGANHSYYEGNNPNDVTWLQEVAMELVKSPTLKNVALSSHRSLPEQLKLAKNVFDMHNSIPYQKNFSLAFGIWCLTQASNYLPKDIAEIIAQYYEPIMKAELGPPNEL